MAINRTLWYVITAVGGQEESIAQSIREKMNNYGYSNFTNPTSNEPSEKLKDGSDPSVVEVRVFMKWDEPKEDIFAKNSPELPKQFRSTKTTKWEALPDGRYKRIKTKRVNRFPSYIFVKATLNPEIWYAVRNTVGVMGFVGSTGKGALPIPCAMEEYERLISEQVTREYAAKVAETLEQPKVEKPVLKESPFKIGQMVIVSGGSFDGAEVKVLSVNLEKQTAKVEYEFFGRTNELEVGFDQLKLAE